MPLDIVVGSGPAGVAAASALVERGCEVLMVDVGEEIEPAAAALRARMGSTERSQWSRADIAAAKEIEPNVETRRQAAGQT